MSHTISTLKARTLSRATINPRKRTRAARLRLDSFESREMPGDMLSPLSAMAGAFGAVAMMPNDASQSNSDVPESARTDQSSFQIADQGGKSSPTSNQTSEKRESDGESQSSAETTQAAFDPADLSLNDPASAFSLPPSTPVGGQGGTSGGGGGSSDPVTSAGAGQSTVAGPATFAGPASGGEADQSLSNASGGDSGTTNSGLAAQFAGGGSQGRGQSNRPLEVFVTPPSNRPGLEGPEPRAASAVAPATTSTPIVAVGTDAGTPGKVKVYDVATQTLMYTLTPFTNAYTGGVRVAVADVTGDGNADVIAARGSGTNKVRVYDGPTGNPLSGALGNFTAFSASTSEGVFVAAGDMTGDGKAEIIVGTDGEPGSTSKVRVFNGANGNVISTKDLTSLGISGGVRVAAGDVNGDGTADVIVGTSPGTTSHVVALDGSNGSLIYDYLPFGVGDRSGVNVAAGDVNGDWYSDVIVGQATGGTLVKVFSGTNTASITNLDAFPQWTGGVRVGAVDANLDGKVDIVAAQGPGDGEVRVLSASGAELDSLHPFGNNFQHGLFVAGDPTPGPGEIGTFDVDPVVTVVALTPDLIEDDITEVSVLFTRAGDTTDDLEVYFYSGGSASVGEDYWEYNGVVLIPSGSSTKVFTYFDLVEDTLVEGTETIILSIESRLGYTIGSPGGAVFTIIDDDGPTDYAGATASGGFGAYLAPSDPNAGDPGFYALDDGSGNVDPAFYVDTPDDSNDFGFFAGGGSYANGSICYSGNCPPGSAGFGQYFSLGWMWESESASASTSSYTGNGISLDGLPTLKTDGTGAVVLLGSDSEYFDGDPMMGYTSRHYSKNSLTYNSTNGLFTYVTSAGATLVFNDFNSSLPTYQQGQIESITDPNGNTTTVTSRTMDGKPLDIQRTSTTGGTTTTESILYTYNSDKIESVTLQRQVGAGSWTTVRKLEMEYYDGSTSNGTSGDLKSVVEKDGSDNTLNTWLYRYYTSSSSPGYVGALKYAISGSAYERFAAWCTANSTTVDSATDGQLAPFADAYFEWDSVHRVTKTTLQGAGCSACSGGLGTTTFTYTTSSFADGYNSWRTKTVETHDDGNTKTVFTNFAGQVILGVYKDTAANLKFATYRRYDTTTGRVVMRALPSAISGYDESYADLLHNQSGNYEFLRDSAGLIEVATYGSSTTATSSTAGDVAGYRSQTKVKRGESGTEILQTAQDYKSRTGDSITVYPLASTTRYRNTNGTGGQTTSFAYTFFSDTIQPESVTVTLPTVTTAQNGSNSANSFVAVSDARGRPIWAKDEAGFISYFEYDDVTGGVTKTIQDVDTTQTSTFANLPSGWSTPSAGGLHLTTSFEVDSLGRTTKVTDPNGNITYIVYKDVEHEVRTYPGWNTSTDAPTGPTIVQREDRDLGYRETITMSATPSLTSSRPNGTESISGIQSLRRQVLNSAGQVVYMDEYFDLTGVSYSQNSVTLGTSGTNYNRTQQDYDKLGLPNRTLTAMGTIYRTVFDGQGRPISQWVGTDDTPTSGFWSPTNTAGTDLVKVSENEYDFGDVGDGLLTKSTQFPSTTSSENRVSTFAYDWRNRLVATKSGVETSESTSVNRPITYAEYDNLGQAIVREQYDGDGLSITTDSEPDGVPDRPSSSYLRAKSTADFDELGRVYKSSTFSVNPSNGTVSSDALVSQQWYNSRGMVMKSSSPGGMVSKSEFDGVGRTTKSYVTDGGGDSGYSDADDVTSDNVLSQMDYTYDANGSTTFVVSRERFHDETDTGALGTPSSGANARVSYSANYYDLAGRLTDSVDVGTNGGSAYSRPGSPDSRSDTVLVNSYGYNSAGQVESVTDASGSVNKTYFDLAGRTTKTVENYVNGTVSDGDDKTVEYTYHANGQMKTLKAYLTSSTSETTEWVLGINSPIVSNDVLKELRYPDTSTGASSSSEKDQYTYNQLGQVLTFTDRNGNVHTYGYDILGRQVSDAITTLGSGVDGAVRRIETAYDTQGNAYLLTSYDAASGGNVVNQIQREFNGLGQMTKEWQAVNGSVNTSTSPKVQYSYSEMSSSANHSRLTSITYPNGRVITHNYASGLANNISRLSSITDGGTTLESYEYLGSGTVVKRGHAEPGVDLTYIKLSGESNADAGDQYIGLDRFGRIADQRWTTSTPTAKDRRQYGYDRDSNRLYFDNLVESTRSELYAYDGLNQLTSMDRGTLNGSKNGLTGAASRSQDWDYDGLGNWDSLMTDGGSAQTRGHNKQNEITSISGASTPTYDANGNLLTDETGKQFVYDAWNRLKIVKNSGGTTLATYAYDAGGRRVRETRSGTTTDLYYSDQWQVLEERVGSDVKKSYVWSPVYVDAMIARDRDTDANGSLDERLYAAHDANFNVVALVDTSGAVVERFAYDAFGVFSVLTPAWGSRASSNYDWVYLHQGGRWDAELAGYSFRNREYSPILGRWFRNDPIGFDGNDVNFYRALSNKPTSALDPMGLESWQEYSYSKGSIRFKFYYKGFSLDQRGQLVRAMIGAFEAIDAAWVDLYFLREGMKKDKNKLSDDNKLTLHRFNQFFCDDNTTVPRSCVEQVQSMLWKMRKGIKGESFDLYIYYDPAEPDHGAWERVRGRMRLGPVFFGKTYTLEQRIATLVHELSHAYGLADDDGGAWTGGFGSNATFDKNPLKTAMRCKSAYAIEAFVDHYYIRKNTKP